MIEGVAGATMEAYAEGFDAGLVGSLEVTIDDGNGNTLVGPTTANIIETATDGVTSIYRYLGVYPSPAADYAIEWYDPAAQVYANEEIRSTVSEVVPAGPGTPGPCIPWITGDDVAACCNVETSSGVIFDEVAAQASDLLFAISGRLYAGGCGPRTVRPGCDSCWCGYQILSRGHIVGPQAIGYPLDSLCDSCLVACDPSMIKLAGYPIRGISEVKVGGDVVAPSEYALHNDRYLVRLNSVRWPRSQNLTLPDTDESTWSITYTYGADPPALAISAAAQLGCEIYKACAGATGGDCVLPTGVTRITRQGVTIDRMAFTSWSYRDGRWATGLPLVDAFLASVNPSGLQRRPVFWAPGHRQYAQPWAP